MAAVDLIVLSSSPSRSLIHTTPQPGSIAAMSSSPGFPSPSQLMQNRRPSITSRNRAYVVPEEVDVSFASAISLHRQAHATDMVAGLSHTEQRDLADKTEVQGGRAKAKRQRKVTIPEANTDALTTKPKAPREKALTARKPLIASNPGNAAIGSEVAAVSKPKKPRAKRAKDEAQTTITKGKVTKPASKDASAKTSKAVKATSTQKSDIVRQGDVQKECEKVTPNELGAETTEYGDQRRAIARRREWTPVKDTGAGAAILSNPASYIPLQKGISVHGCSRNTEFEALLNGYDYTKAHGKVTGPASVRNTDGEALTKRRKLELVTTSIHPPAPVHPVRRSRSPRKKPRTITEKATAQFVTEDTSAEPTLIDFFVLPTLQDPSGAGLPDSNAVQQSSTIKHRKPSAKVAAKRNSKKQATEAPILLSPESALKTTKDQELLFGTSSQLAREESPTFIRDIQQALEASNTVQEQKSFVNSRCGAESSMSTSSTASVTTLSVSSKNLWSVAARDFQGLLLDAEVIDLADTPKAREIVRDYSNAPKLSKSKTTVRESTIDTDWTNIDRLIEPQPADSLGEQFQPTNRAGQNDVQPPMPRSIAEAALRQRPKTRSPTKNPVHVGATNVPEPKTLNTEKPDYKSYTTAQLSKAILAYGFKPIKNRDQMIILMEKCWEGKNRIALQSLPPNTNIIQPPSENPSTDLDKERSPVKRKGRPPKTKGLLAVSDDTPVVITVATKPRGRPRKGNALLVTASSPAKRPAPTILPSPIPPQPSIIPSKPKQKAAPAPPAEEISDSDNPHTPSPPRRRRSSPPATPQTLKLTTPSPETSTETPSVLSPSAPQTHLFAKITQAITAFPPTHDPKNLTWHEKILMYDPIVLEDLAAWLNTQGLERVGVDEEVGPAVVRAWCEERSICCLWKENLRGGKRSRY